MKAMEELNKSGYLVIDYDLYADRRLTGHDRDVLSYYWSFKRKGQDANVGPMLERLHISWSTARRSIESLKKLGYLNNGVFGKTGDNKVGAQVGAQVGAHCERPATYEESLPNNISAEADASANIRKEEDKRTEAPSVASVPEKCSLEKAEPVASPTQQASGKAEISSEDCKELQQALASSKESGKPITSALAKGQAFDNWLEAEIEEMSSIQNGEAFVVNSDDEDNNPQQAKRCGVVGEATDTHKDRHTPTFRPKRRPAPHIGSDSYYAQPGDIDPSGKTYEEAFARFGTSRDIIFPLSLSEVSMIDRSKRNNV